MYKKRVTVWFYGHSIRIVTHKGAQVASQHCPILPVVNRNISSTERNYNTKTITLANGHYKAQSIILRLKSKLRKYLFWGTISSLES